MFDSFLSIQTWNKFEMFFIPVKFNLLKDEGSISLEEKEMVGSLLSCSLSSSLAEATALNELAIL